MYPKKAAREYFLTISLLFVYYFISLCNQEYKKKKIEDKAWDSLFHAFVTTCADSGELQFHFIMMTSLTKYW